MMSSFTYKLDVNLMKKGAELFLGMHNFRRYCTKPSEKTNFNRDMLVSEIVENDIYKANFFPKKSYMFRVRSEGFMRNQVRLMMGQLIMLGKGEISIDDLEKSLLGIDGTSFRYIAPASGLILNKIEYLT